MTSHAQRFGPRINGTRRRFDVALAAPTAADLEATVFYQTWRHPESSMSTSFAVLAKDAAQAVQFGVWRLGGVDVAPHSLALVKNVPTEAISYLTVLELETEDEWAARNGVER